MLTPMSRPEPQLWFAIAALLRALRTLLRDTAPEAFAAVSASARAQLAAVTAMARRYLHCLAAGLVLPPRRATSADQKRMEHPHAPMDGLWTFPLTERTAARHASSRSGGADAPALQWALAWEAAGRLAAVLAEPERHARRLALYLRRAGSAVLRDMPVRWHVLRRLGPVADALLIHLDQRARPGAWAAIGEGPDTS